MHQQPKGDGMTIWRLSGLSMGKGWGPEALLGVQPFSAAEPPTRGDVIVFEMAGVVVAHRVIARRRGEGGWGYVTQGDARWHPDQMVVPESTVRGVVVRVWRDRREIRLDGIRGGMSKKLRWLWLRFKTVLAMCRGVFRAA
jgi:hypothetical protein